jgi:zinc protease
MASSLAGIEVYGLGLDYWARYPQLIDAVTAAQVNAAIRKYVHPEALHTILVGPVKEAPAK